MDDLFLIKTGFPQMNSIYFDRSSLIAMNIFTNPTLYIVDIASIMYRIDLAVITPVDIVTTKSTLASGRVIVRVVPSTFMARPSISNIFGTTILEAVSSSV
jgi:hypothetical protein